MISLLKICALLACGLLAAPLHARPSLVVTLSSLGDRIRSQNPDLAAAQEVGIEQSRRYEDVEGGIFAAAERSEDVPAGYDTEAIIGFRFKIPLPLWNDNSPAIAAASARQQRVEAEADALARNIWLVAEAARAEMLQWSGILRQIDQTLLPLAENQFSLAETAWRDGQGSLQAMLLARTRHLDLAFSRLDALLEFHLARLESRQPGNPPPVLELRAPGSGLVIESQTHLDAPVEPDMDLMTILDLTTVWAVAKVPQNQASLLTKGLSARVSVPATGKESYQRLVPVLMTALSAGIALIPLVLAPGEPGKEILHPVAVAIVGGLVSSTLLDLVVTPAVFFLIGRKAAEKALRLDARAAR